MSDLIIDETNFDQYFFDTRKHKPKPGQVLACYEAAAELVDGDLKRDLLCLLMTTDKAEAAQRLLQKLGGASYEDSVRVCREMTEDLVNGMLPEEVAEKPYRYRYQSFYYTNLEYVPDNDPHWWSSSLIDIRLPENLDLTFVDENQEEAP